MKYHQQPRRGNRRPFGPAQGPVPKSVGAAGEDYVSNEYIRGKKRRRGEASAGYWLRGTSRGRQAERAERRDRDGRIRCCRRREASRADGKGSGAGGEATIGWGWAASIRERRIGEWTDGQDTMFLVELVARRASAAAGAKRERGVSRYGEIHAMFAVRIV